MLKLFFLVCLMPLCLLAHFEKPWGKDSDVKYTASKKEKSKTSLAGKAANAVITFHQKVLSPIDGPRSHFRPTSSRYMQLAIKRYGFIKGYLMGCDRLLRENGEEWVYRTIEKDGKAFKYDPAVTDKFTK